MSRRATETKFSRFTPLLESGSGLRSRRTSDGISAYKGVTIIKAGLGNHRDRNYYPAETLERAVKSGQFDGLRAYADHPDSVSEEIQPERTVRDLVGVYQNPRFVREGRSGGRIVADLHLVRSAKWLSETIDDLIALKQADKIGLSINGRGRTVEKSMQLEEAADPVDVNYVEEFMALRSADVVTEAGAGGGFQQLLESAKGTARRTTHTKENGMKGPNAKQKKAIEAAQKAGDWDKVAKILKECGCGSAEPVKEAKGRGRKKADDETAEVTESRRRTRAAAAADEADDVEESEEDEVDPLDAEHEDVVSEADELLEEGDDEVSEDDEDLEEADEEGDTDLDDVDESGDDEDLEEADEDEEPAEPRRGNGRHPLANAAERIRGAASRTRERDAESRRETREASRQPIVKGGAGVVTRAKGGSKRNNARGPGNGRTAFVGVQGLRGSQRKSQPGRRFGESQMDSPALTKLQREIEKLRETNARLSTSLRVRSTADRARNLLRESSIPEKMRPEILRLMVGKSEDEMARVVRYHERLIESAVEEIGGAGHIEGAGTTRIRESHHGGGDRGDDLTSLLESAGIPLAGDNEDDE